FLLTLDKRPLLDGVFAGLLVYKFQFGLLIPVALIMGGYGKTFLSAAATVGMMTLGVTVLYGHDIWPAFFHNVVNQMRYFEGSDQQLEMIHSLFSFVHHTMGAPKGLGYAAQGIIQVGVLGCILWLWRKKNAVPYALKAAALVSGSLLMTPYLMDYDLFVLLPALVFIGRYQKDFGFVPYGKLIPILLWVMCAFARQLYGLTMIPFGFLTLLATFGFVMVLAKQGQHRKNRK
ncbi:MAG: glycosyltransferase family 87 protein, partial [Alphaproteobacteria bacterium]